VVTELDLSMAAKCDVKGALPLLYDMGGDNRTAVKMVSSVAE